MEKFIVSARKYRPQTFDTVVGQAHITTTLKNAIQQNQLAHAFLFCGPRGVGKTTCARILAKTINCEHLTPEGEACNTCNSCVSFNQGTSLNIHELDAASNNSVDDIRARTEKVRFAPQAGRYKVYIIDEVHMLSAQAFNAFLKTLEEPPHYAIFILATTEKHKIIPTILSRCQIFDFKRISTGDTARHLAGICEKEDIKAEMPALQVIAQKSEGCLRDALSLMDKIVSFTNGELTYANTLEHLNILDEDYYFKLMGQMLNQDLTGAMLLYDDINRKGFEGDLVLNGFASFIRNLLVSKDEKAAVLLDVVEDFRDKYAETAKKIPTPLLISALNILNEAEINFRMARNKRLHVELTLIKLCYLQQAMTLTAEGDTTVKKKLIETAGALAFRQIQPVIAPQKKTALPKSATPSAGPRPEARLTVQQEKPVKVSPANRVQNPVSTTPVTRTTKISGIEKIREKFKGHTPREKDLPLTVENLKNGWDAFSRQLREAKNSAAQSYELATLKIIDENTFYVYASNSVEYMFVESCKTQASEFLQQELKNYQLQFFIIKMENKEEEEPGQQPLSALQQYQRMIEKYPLLKELKEKLKLDVDR